jgi:hypothetical protein
MKPFKTVKIEYFDENSTSHYGPPPPERRIKVVTTTEHWIGSTKDPIITTKFEYL